MFLKTSVRFRGWGWTEQQMEMPASTQDPLILAQAIAALPGLVQRVSTLEAEIATLRKAAKPSVRKCLSLKESAEILGVSQKTVSRFIERKLLRRSPLTALVRIPREDVEALAKATL
jgi:excisionase family DNA binding protein